MKIVGITRVRNEESIIQNTLDHVSKYVDSIHVYDDASEDNTQEVCFMHPAVEYLHRNHHWDSDPVKRAKAEGLHRQTVYESAIESGADWVYCFDADEYIEPLNLDFKADAYYFRLFDFYITPKDISKSYLYRRYIGPEYRDIPMMFRVNPKLRFTQRIPRGIGNDLRFGGYVKHYGKAISVEHWEDTCDYYINYRWNGRQTALQKRWKDRKGKAIHVKSDFGRDLITWEKRKNEKLIEQI